MVKGFSLHWLLAAGYWFLAAEKFEEQVSIAKSIKIC
jgi:hypothetical protein